MLSGAGIILRMGCAGPDNANVMNWLRKLLPMSPAAPFDFVEAGGALNI